MDTADLIAQLSPLADYLPATWQEGAGYALTTLVALRTGLRASVAFFSWLDGAIDGVPDEWVWPSKTAAALDAVDGWLAKWAPVKAVGMREKRAHAAKPKAQL